MEDSFHESFTPGEVKPPSPRATGLVLAGAAVVVALIWRDTPATLWIGLAVALVLLTAGLYAPRLLQPLNIAWFQIGLLAHRVVNPLVMFILFAIVFVPAGLLLRIRHDPLRSKRAKDASTYWISREGGPSGGGSMTKQF